jgi:hypothetical protein
MDMIGATNTGQGEGISGLEANKNYLALPCYFFLRAKDFFQEIMHFKDGI